MSQHSLPQCVLVLGGARSGKSRWALLHCERHYQRPLYLATAQAGDDEMFERIRQHRRERSDRWHTVEEPLEIARTIGMLPDDVTTATDVILVDCLTLWLTNVLLSEGEKAVEARQRELLNALASASLPVVLVSNEVGLGLVPDNELGRAFRDCAGRLNQQVATAADLVVFVAAGLPLALKGVLPQ